MGEAVDLVDDNDVDLTFLDLRTGDAFAYLAGQAPANPSGTVSAAILTMADKCDQNDDGDRHT